MFDLIELIKDKTGMTYTDISTSLGVSPGYIAQLKARNRTSEKFTLKLREYYNKLTNDNEKEIHRLKYNASPIGVPIGEYQNKTNSFTELSEGRFLLKTKLVSKKAKAGYLTGWGDDEFLESLPEHVITTEKPVHGIYMSFEIDGDSMDYDGRDSIPDKSIVTGRLVSRSHWKDKLHLHKFKDFIIVCYEGILCKRIIDHDVKAGTITIHSLNTDKDAYPDEIIDLRTVMQIFNIVKKETNI